MSDTRAIPPVDVHLDEDRRVAVVSPHSEAHRTIVALLGFKAWLDPFELQRFGLIAHETSSRIVVPENPGCGPRSVGVTPRDTWQLARGDFSPLARRSIDQVAPWLHDDQPLHLLGYSMGASVAAAVLAADALPRPVTTTLVEPVAASAWPVRRLLRALEEEDHATDAFLDANAGWAHAALPWDRTPDARAPVLHRLTLTASGLGVAGGRIYTDLRSAHERAGGPQGLVLVRGDKSVLCPAVNVAHLRERLADSGIDSRELNVPGRHALWHSLDAVRALAALLAEIWRRHEDGLRGDVDD